jgi:hypothetical protein
MIVRSPYSSRNTRPGCQWPLLQTDAARDTLCFAIPPCAYCFASERTARESGIPTHCQWISGAALPMCQSAALALQERQECSTVFQESQECWRPSARTSRMVDCEHVRAWHPLPWGQGIAPWCAGVRRKAPWCKRFRALWHSLRASEHCSVLRSGRDITPYCEGVTVLRHDLKE